MSEQVSIDRYTGFEPIGSGGFSRVYRAWRADQDRFVAVKVLALGSDREIDRDAFAAECRAMGAVSNHPNVVTAFDNGFTNEGYPFIAMELCPESLTDRMKAAPDQRLEVGEVLSLGAQIFTALERAHDKGILHRDLKPQNILFTEFGLPALTDFGIAALAGDTKSQQNWALSRHYAAPEVINDEPHTVACDIYSLGATIYTALAGRRPFSRSGDNDPERLEERIRTESPPAFDPAWVPEFVAHEIMRLLSKHPRDRPRTAGEAAQRLVKLQERLGHTASLIDTGENAEGDITETRPPDGQVDDLDTGDLTTSDLTSMRSSQPDSPLVDDQADVARRPLLAVGLLVAVIAAFVLAVVVSQRGGGTVETPLVTPTLEPVDPADAVVTIASAPDAPTQVELEQVDDGTLISWTEVEGAERYRVDFPGSERNPVMANEPELLVDRAPDGDVLCVVVLAVNADKRVSEPGSLTCG